LLRDLDTARAFIRSAQSKEAVKSETEPCVVTDAPADVFIAKTVDDEVVEDRSPDPVPVNPTPQTQPPATKDARPQVAAYSKPRSARRWLSVTVVVAAALLALELPRSRTESRASVSEPVSIPTPAVTTATLSPPAPAVVRGTARVVGGQTALRVPPPAANLIESPQPQAESGTLAISSPAAVDIYKNDAYLGSAPVTLELPAGSQTIEYRHGVLRKLVTHVINSNEATKVTITFDVSLQINSKPWAEVSVDGVDKKALGQTPLSDVRVPIGSVLIFENPQFAPKRYRVTGDETGIQIVFP
jgi:hypothetical protein